MKTLLLASSLIGIIWAAPTSKVDFTPMRDQMVESQIAGRDVIDAEVLKAMRAVPRHLFVRDGYQERSYGDHPLPIGEGQTISQPYIVAKMSELGGLKKGYKVLEIGTGSGYQAAVLAELGVTVYSIEIIEKLSKFAQENLKRAGYEKSVHLRVGDGYQGWPEQAPFDAILVTAAPPQIPSPLIEQLKVGGKLVIPVGPPGGFYSAQKLMVVTKTEKGNEQRVVFPVAFVPMTGEAQKK